MVELEEVCGVRNTLAYITGVQLKTKILKRIRNKVANKVVERLRTCKFYTARYLKG